MVYQLQSAERGSSSLLYSSVTAQLLPESSCVFSWLRDWERHVFSAVEIEGFEILIDSAERRSNHQFSFFTKR